MDREEEEQHSMSKPKPLEDPLTEVKKKPEFRYYMDAGGNPQQLDKNYLDDERRERQRKNEQRRGENLHSDFSSDSDKMTPTPEQIANKKIRDEKEAQEAIDSKARHTHRRKKKMWKTWLEKKEKPKKEEPEIQYVEVPKEEEEETVQDNVKQVAGAEAGEGLLHLIGLSHKKVARLGDLSQYKLPKSKPSKYKDPQTMTKFPKKLGKPVRKIESAEIDNEGRVQHGQFKEHPTGSVGGVETKTPKMESREGGLQAESLAGRVQHKKPNPATQGGATPISETDPHKTEYGSSPTEDLEHLPPATRKHPDKKRAERGERVSTGLREQRVGLKRLKTPYGRQQGGEADIEFFSGKQKALFGRWRKRRSTNASPEDLKRDDKPQSSLNPKRRPSTSIQAPDKTIGTTKPQKQTKIETERYMSSVPKESLTPPDKFPKSHEVKPKVSQMGRIQANQGKKEPPIKQANPLQTLTERKQPERTTAIGTEEPDKPTGERKVPHAKEAAIMLKTLMIKMYMINKKRVQSREPTGDIDPKKPTKTVHDTISGGFATAQVPRKVGMTIEGMKRVVEEDKDRADPPNVTTTHPGGEIRGTTEGADPKLQPPKPRTSKPKPKPKPSKGSPIAPPTSKPKPKFDPRKYHALSTSKYSDAQLESFYNQGRLTRDADGHVVLKGLGALGQGKLNRYTGRKMKLKPRKRTLDEYEHDNKPSYFKQIASEEEKKNKEEIAEAERAALVNKDYFIEEIRANIIFEDKIAPLLGMIAGRVGQAVLGAGKKMAEGVKQTGKWLVTPQDEEEEY